MAGGHLTSVEGSGPDAGFTYGGESVGAKDPGVGANVVRRAGLALGALARAACPASCATCAMHTQVLVSKEESSHLQKSSSVRPLCS